MKLLDTSNTWTQRAVVFGAAAWGATLAASLGGAFPLALIEQLFLLGPLVVVPLGLDLAARHAGRGWPRILLAFAQRLQPGAAALAVASFYVTEGEGAAWLCAPWMLVTGLAGLAGLPFLKRIFTNPNVAGFEAGLLYLPVGGIWLLITRMGYRPLGLEEPIILLTAVHFHFSGFAASVYSACAGHALEAADRLRRRIFAPANIGVLGGTFLVAIGFLLSPQVKFAAILLYGVSLFTVAILVSTLVPDIESRLARMMLLVSSGALCFGTLLAAVYGLGEAQGALIITVPRMAETHGIINALGFVVCGLLGWRAATAADAKPASTPIARYFSIFTRSHEPHAGLHRSLSLAAQLEVARTGRRD